MKFVKKTWFLISVCLAIVITSCGGYSNEQEYFDENMLVGKWVNDKDGDDYYVYRSNHSGYMWNESDDVSENEAMNDPNFAFSWEMSNATLTILNSTTMIGEEAIPKVYTLKRLTEIRLEYYDPYSSMSLTRCRD